jgi:hypothetical protein
MRAIDGSVIHIPPVPPFPPDTPLPAEALDPIRQQIAPFNAMVAQQNDEQKALFAERGWSWFMPQPSIEESTAVDHFLALVNGAVSANGLPVRSPNPLSPMMRNRTWDQQAFRDLLSRPEFTLWHLLRLVCAEAPNAVLSAIDTANGVPGGRMLRARLEQGLDFRLVVLMLAKLGQPADGAMRTILHRYGCHSAAYADLDCPSLGFYFLERLDLIEEALGLRPRSGEEELSEKGALQLLAWLPKVPDRLLRPLLDMALGRGKQMRAPARSLLATAAGIDDAIVARLADAKKEVRALAAEWIGERRMSAALPALKAAQKKERSEEGRAALLTALARLGEDISSHFSQKALKAEAEKGLAKTPAKSLEWFPFAALPSLKLGDGKTVDPVIVKWWIVLADKLKDPAGNALFELYLDRLKTDDAGRFGLFLLQAFIERDTATCTEEEALAYAKQITDQTQQWRLTWQQQHPEQAARYPFNYEHEFARAKAVKLREWGRSSAPCRCWPRQGRMPRRRSPTSSWTSRSMPAGRCAMRRGRWRGGLARVPAPTPGGRPWRRRRSSVRLHCASYGSSTCPATAISCASAARPTRRRACGRRSLAWWRWRRPSQALPLRRFRCRR